RLLAVTTPLCLHVFLSFTQSSPVIAHEPLIQSSRNPSQFVWLFLLFCQGVQTNMATPSPGYSIIVKVQAPATFTATSDLTAVVAGAGAAITALDIVDASHESNIINLTCNTRGEEHSRKVKDAINGVSGFEERNLSDRSFHMHQCGKLQPTSKVTVRNRDDLSRADTPGVARVCTAIAKYVNRAREL